jgi:hypothetical protein
LFYILILGFVNHVFKIYLPRYYFYKIDKYCIINYNLSWTEKNFFKIFYPISSFQFFVQIFRTASEGSNDSLESLSLSSEGFCESDREMDIEEEE